MKPLMKVFVADVVPLSNKGEEAIIRGIEDLLRQDHPIELAVFDDVPAPVRVGLITVFPQRWIYTVSGTPMGISARLAWLAALTMGMLVGRYGKINRLRGGGGSQFKSLAEWFNNADLVLVGHDGVFCPESCGILRMARRSGKRAGILGSGMSDYSILTPLVRPLFRRAVADSQFCVFREQHAFRFMASLTEEKDKLLLAPDPAFAMRPAKADEVGRYLEGLDVVAQTRRLGRPVITCTVCQKDVLLRRAFPEGLTPDEKRRKHVAYLANVLNSVLRSTGALLVFLPHSIEEGPRNDVVTAEAVVAALPEEVRGLTFILRDDLSARMLKGIIAASDFLIGQRAHSMIGSASVATPFAGLVASNDRRTHEILGQMCGCEESLINMDLSSAEQTAQATLRLFHDRARLRTHLCERMVEFRGRLDEVARRVLGPFAA